MSDMQENELENAARRRVVAGLAAGVAIVAAPATAQAPRAPAPAGDEVTRAFIALLRPETRGDMLTDGAIVIDSDAPFPMRKPDHLDHLAFHRELWESRDWAPYDLRNRTIGDSAFVSAYLLERGKPKGAGFRLQPLYATAVLVRTSAGWRALSLHLGALRGQITDISPG
jgi:hypothetical protein